MTCICIFDKIAHIQYFYLSSYLSNEAAGRRFFNNCDVATKKQLLSAYLTKLQKTVEILHEIA
jgi:hypothetical protein